MTKTFMSLYERHVRFIERFSHSVSSDFLSERYYNITSLFHCGVSKTKWLKLILNPVRLNPVFGNLYKYDPFLCTNRNIILFHYVRLPHEIQLMFDRSLYIRIPKFDFILGHHNNTSLDPDIPRFSEFYSAKMKDTLLSYKVLSQ